MFAWLKTVEEFILDLLFPPSCISCGKQGTYLCYDCLSLIEILEYQYCPVCKKRILYPDYIRKTSKILPGTCKTCKTETSLDGLYAACPYQNRIVSRAIKLFERIRELSDPLADLIIAHFEMSNQMPKDFIVTYIPLLPREIKEQGFSRSELIALSLSEKLNLPFKKDVLTKIFPQTSFKENILKDTFKVKDEKRIKDKKILLVNDLYSTGSIMNECARALKEAGAKEVWGTVTARE